MSTMQSTDFDLIKDIPGYKVILKTVLKKQIQQLVEQLADHTGEESVLLTASVSDGSLGHLGSESGKVFLQDHDDIKSQFLGFCLKRHHTQKQNENRQQQQRQSNVESYLTFTSMGPERRQSFPPLHAPQPPSLHIPMQFQNSSQFSSSPADIHPVALTLAQPQPVSKTGHSNARPEPYSKKRPRKKQERSRLSHQESGSMKLPTELGTVKDNDAGEVLVKVEVSDDQSDLSGVHSSDKSENSNHTGGKITNQNYKSSSSKSSLATSRISLATSQVSLMKDSETNSSSSNIKNEAADDNKTIVEDISLDQGLVSLGDNMDEAGDTGSVSQGEISEVDPTADVKLECITESDIELEITGEPGLMTNPDKNWASGGPPGVGSDKGQGQGQSYTGRSRRASTGGTQEFGRERHSYLNDRSTTAVNNDFKTTVPRPNNFVLHPTERRIRTKNHGCSICGKAFSSRWKLDTHQRVHTGAKPFQCEICGRYFSQKGSVKIHMLTHISSGKIQP